MKTHIVTIDTDSKRIRYIVQKAKSKGSAKLHALKVQIHHSSTRVFGAAVKIKTA